MGFPGSLVKTVSGIASTALGGVSQVRKILDFNPGQLGLLLPPQISLGIKAAQTVGGLVGIKVPSQEDLLKFATGKLDPILQGIRSSVKTPLEQFESALKSLKTNPLSFAQTVLSKVFAKGGLATEEILNRIDWLL